MKAADFSNYLQSKFYPHISSQHMFGTKITFLKSFIRSQLAMRGWTNLSSLQNTPISSNKFELSKDAILIVVQDKSKTLREKLSEEEMAKYADSAFRNHVKSKYDEKGSEIKSKKYDALLDASQNRTPGQSKWGSNARPEVGVSIQVGI